MNDKPASAGPILNRSKRLAGTILSTWLRSAITMAVGLISTPFLLQYLGSERYGATSVAIQWFAYLEFLTFGLGAALSVLLLRVATSDSCEALPDKAYSGIRLMSRQLVWILPVASGLILVFPYVFHLSSDLSTEFYWAAPAILLGVCLLPTVVFRYVVEARQQGYLINVSLALQAIVTAIFGVGLAACGSGLTGQFWAVFLGLLASVLANAYFSGAMYRLFWAGSLTVIDRAAVWKLQWPLLVVGIGNQINVLSDSMMVGMLVGLPAVAGYVFTQKLLQLATVVSGSLIGNGSWSGLVDLRARAGQEAFKLRLIEISKLNIGISLLVLAPVLGLTRRFVALWVGIDQYAGDTLVVTTYVFLGVFAWLCLYAALIDNFGLTRRRVWVSTAGTLLKMVLTIPFVQLFGVTGVPLAGIIGYLATDAWFCPLILCREQRVSLRAILAGLMRALPLGGVWAASCFLLGNRDFLLLSGWGGLVVDAAILEASSLILAWSLLLSPADRQRWRQRISGWFYRPVAPVAKGAV